MTTDHDSNRASNAPSTKERIDAMIKQGEVLETIAKHPQAGIVKRFGKEWARAMAYVEAKVHRDARAVDQFFEKHGRPASAGQLDGDGALDKGLEGVMDPSVDNLLLLYRVFKASREMAMSPPPSKLFMDLYRNVSATGKENTRAANGELLSTYGRVNDPVPFDLTTLDNEDLERLPQFLVNWLMDPFIDYIGVPFLKLWSRLLGHREPDSTMDVDVEVVNARTVSAVATALVSIIAVLLLVAPIATLNNIEKTNVRIIVMTLFGEAFAASALFMGSRSIPLYTLITAYFQAMVIFVGTTSQQRARQ